MEIIFGILLWFGIIAAYFAPTATAYIVGHKDTLAIFLTNLLLGWTFIGWIVAIIWAAKSEEKRTINS